MLNVALSSADFVLKDLSRTQLEDGFLFSYSVTDGNNTVINASLLGAKILSYFLNTIKIKNILMQQKKQLSLDADCKSLMAHGFTDYYQYKTGKTAFIRDLI